ncbi:MAG: hypothetical protein ACREJG_14210, partial [Candidatus Rokuibacteriota bacterium]
MTRARGVGRASRLALLLITLSAVWAAGGFLLSRFLEARHDVDAVVSERQRDADRWRLWTAVGGSWL